MSFLKGYDTIIHADTKKVSAAMAQSVERVLGKDEVTGSNPVSSSKKKRTQAFWLVFFFYVIILKSGDLRTYQGINRAPKNNCEARILGKRSKTIALY